MTQSRCLLFLLLLFPTLHAIDATVAHRNQPSFIDEENSRLALNTIRSLVSGTEDSIDLASAKVAIDKLIDPSIDEAKVIAEIDALASRIRSRIPLRATPKERIETLLKFLYTPGVWNEFRPFRYDLEDPFGKAIPSKLLANYLASRKGNCVSMPILVLLLGQRLDLEIALATAPLHMLVKYRDESGQWTNIEATSGGYKADDSYAAELGITSLAMKNAIYLRPLSKREAVGAMSDTLMEFYGISDKQEARIALADIALKADPRNTAAMLHKGNAYFKMLKKTFLDVYPSMNSIPRKQRGEFSFLSGQNLLWFQRAEALGWSEPNQSQESDYKTKMIRLREKQR